MKKSLRVKSDCCNAELKLVGGMPDFEGDFFGITMHYECMKCKKPCNQRENLRDGLTEQIRKKRG